MAQIRDAKKSGDQEKVKELHQQLKAAVVKDGGEPAKAALKQIEDILTKDQAEKLKELWKAAHPGHTGKKPNGEKKSTTPNTLDNAPKGTPPANPEAAVSEEEKEDLLNILKENHPEIYTKVMEGQ